jgi:hypothetical protein
MDLAEVRERVVRWFAAWSAPGSETLSLAVRLAPSRKTARALSSGSWKQWAEGPSGPRARPDNACPGPGGRSLPGKAHQAELPVTRHPAFGSGIRPAGARAISLPSFECG